MIEKINTGRQYEITGKSKSVSRPAGVKPAEASRTEQVSKVDAVEIGTRRETPVTYSKAAKRQLDASEIAALKSEAEMAAENLRRLVEQLILKQNENYRVSAGDSPRDIPADMSISTADMEAARIAVSEDGEFGVKAVSDRLVDFAISISGGDKSKLEELISAIDAGFAAAKETLGGELPDICIQTYDETMRKLNEWAKAE
jgi:hypothetical protein